jgi:hypothetical protein
VLAFTATVSALNPDGPAGTSAGVGGTGNFRVFGGPLVPFSVTLQGGVGYSDVGGVDVTHIPLGVGLALIIPNPALAIKPWLAPRIDVVHTSPSSDCDELSCSAIGTDTRTKFGLSGGIELNLLNGFGAHASYDYVKGEGGNPGIFGIGAHYTFRVRGL